LVAGSSDEEAVDKHLCVHWDRLPVVGWKWGPWF
jgi:hypothetical protein